MNANIPAQKVGDLQMSPKQQPGDFSKTTLTVKIIFLIYLDIALNGTA
jgi:hypothetical protein